MKTHAQACTLAGPELLQRIQEWRKVAARAKSRTMTGNVVMSAYPRDPGLVAELHRLAEAEKECCPFMEFQIDEGPEEVLVRLDVPEGMQHLLGLIVGLATNEA
ncbi:MAG: hypothetical protein ABR505_01060 [Actinomycetota bacterium]